MCAAVPVDDGEVDLAALVAASEACEWPEVPPEVMEAWAAELDAEDVAHTPSAEQTIAAAESDPLSPGLLAELAAVDVTALRGADVVAAAVAWQRVRNLADAQIAAAVATLHAQTHDDPLLSRRDIVAAEIGAALRLGTRASGGYVDTCVTLTGRLPATFAAVRSGGVAFDKAAMLAGAIDVLDDTKAAAVEARVLP